MTEIYGLFDAADPEAPDRVYTSEAFARLFRTIMRDGVVHNDGDELAVSPTVPAAMSVNVGTGMALVQGRYLINDADLTLAVEAADPSYPRIDRVVVRADLVGRTVHAVVKKGTAAASPVAPPLTRTAETWELSLAQVRVEAGATSIVAAKITDERGNVSLCGVAAPVYVPSTQLEVVGAVDMQGKALTGLPVPSAATDAARKGYVDSELAAKIAGFGISQIAIDADKDWGGKNITNVGNLSVTGIKSNANGVALKIDPFFAKASDTLRASSDAQVFLNSSTLLKKKEIQLSPYLAGNTNSFRVSFTLGNMGTPSPQNTARIYVNGSPFGETYVAPANPTVDITGLKANDKIQLYGTGSSGSPGYIEKFRIYADYEPGFDFQNTAHTVVL